jgi:glycosyltransferase 2 family protein
VIARRRVTRGAVFLLRLAVTGLALGFLLTRYDVAPTLDLVWRAANLYLGLACAGAGVHVMLMVWRWQVLCKLLSGKRLAFSYLLIGFGRSLLLGQVLPSSVGADAIRVMTVARDAGFGLAVRSVVCDRLLGLLALLTLVVATLPLFARSTGNAALVAGILLFVLAAAAALVLTSCFPGIIGRIPLVGRNLGVSASDLRLVITSWTGAASIGGLAIAAHLISVLVFAGFAKGLGSSTTLLDSIAIVPVALLVTSVPISLGGWGVREAALASSFAAIGADPLVGAVASVLFGLSSPLTGAVIELFDAARRGTSPPQGD